MQSLGNYLKKIISYSCNLFFITYYIISSEINYLSIEYSLSPYYKFLPTIQKPFDEEDYYYANYENSYAENDLSINHTYRKNKKVKSIKKLKRFKSDIEEGLNRNTFIIINSHHENNIGIPIVVDLDWYYKNAILHNQRNKLIKKIKKNFTNSTNRRNIPDAALRLINQDLAGTNVALNIRGDISINGEVIFEDKELIALNSNESKSFDVDIEQTQRFDLEGKIGEKLTLNATQDSEADFNWENDLTIKWEGNRNDILQLAEAGNINLSLPSTQFVSVGSGKSEGLFGLKTVHQFGPLEIQSILSREQVKKAVKSFSGGQSAEWSYINDYNFIKDRYFFIEEKYKSQFYPLQINNGNLVHSFNPNGIIFDYEIYKKSLNSNNDGVLDIVYGTAFIDPLDPTSTQISGNWKKLIEGQDYQIDRLHGFVRLNNISSQEAVAISYDYGNYDSNTSTYTKNPDLINGTDLELVYDECLDENYNQTDEICDSDNDGVETSGIDYIELNEIPGFQSQEPKPITMKLIKMDSPTTPNYETWPLMFKNVYSLGSSISDLNSLELEIVYNNAGLEETHSQVNNFQSFLTIFGLDTRNSNGDAIYDSNNEFFVGDGKIDANPILINPINGELFLPSHLPFAYDNSPRTDYNVACNNNGTIFYGTIQECQDEEFEILNEIFNYSDFSNSNVYWGINSEDLEYYLDKDLEDQNNDFSITDDGPAMYFSIDNQEIISEHEFMIKYKHSSGNSSIDLGGFMIVEGSETITLNGATLARGVDYTIDYFSGTVNFINADAMLPGANINITYEENELISVDQKLLFGTHLKYGFDSKNFISGGLFYYDQSIMDENVEIGYEPMRNFIWNINGRYEKELEKLNNVLNEISFLDLNAPSILSFEGEFAEVYPNPNPLGAGFLDDFESSKRSISLNLSARGWKAASSPYDSLGNLKSIELRDKMIWYNPYNEIQTTDIWPTQETSSQAGNAYTKTLWLRPLFDNQDNDLDLWNGITTPLYTSDYDLSRKKYLEIWVNAENFEEDEIMLHIDLGHVSEDINQDNYLNTEDIDVYGNGWGDNNLSEEEDIGIDLCPDLYEDGSGGCNCKYRPDTYSSNSNEVCTPEDQNPNAAFDPNGDNWCYNSSGCSDVNYYRQYNGTEGNADLGRYPDTEDLDKDYNLDVRDDYFTTSFDPAGDDYDEFIASTNWKLFRVLLNDFMPRGDSTATWTDIRHIRLWVDGLDQNNIEDEDNPRALKIAKLEIVGNEWLELGSTTISDIASSNDDEFIEEPYFAVSVLNTHDNPNEYIPPNEQVRGELDQVSGIRMKEQSLVLSFEKNNNFDGGIDSDEAFAIKKSFSALPMDKKNSFFAYDNLNMYVYGDQDTTSGGFWQDNNSNVELLFRFGKDEQYYEIRQPIYKKWDSKNHIDINIDQLTKYKLQISLEEFEDTGLDGCFSNIEDGYGSCLDTLSFAYICESNENLDININQQRCNDYLMLPENSALRINFDPNKDGPIFSGNPEPTTNDGYDLDNITEMNSEYDCIEPYCNISMDEYVGEPFIDLNENYLFDRPPAFYDSSHDVWVWNENIENVCNFCDELRIKGTPSINNIEFIMVSVLNNTDETVYGNVWLDELRMTGVKKEKGQAFRLKSSINFSDLLNINSTYVQKDGDFHLLQERLGTGDNQKSVNLSAKISSGKLLPNKWGLKIPINLNYNYDVSSPKFYPGTDIISGDIDDAPVEIKTINEKSSISTSFDKNTKSENIFLKYTIDKIKFNFSFVDRFKSTPTIFKEVSNDISTSTSYDYNFSDKNFIQPFKILTSIPFFGQKLSETRLYWSPENFSTSFNLSEHNKISTQRTGSVTPTYSLNLDRKYKVNYRLTKNIKIGFQKDINSNYDDIFLPDGKNLSSNLSDVIEGFFNQDDNSFGLIKNKSEGFNINFIPDFIDWLNPSIKYSSSYSWALSNDQNSANIGSNGSLTSSIGFSLTDWVEKYYKPEKSQSKNRRRGRGSKPNTNSNEEPKEISNPVIKSIFKWVHKFSERFSKINVNHTYKVNNTHGNILVNDDPSIYYRLGFSTDPHNGSTSYNENSSSVNSYYHQYSNDFKISTNVTLTKKIQASIDFRDNRVLTMQSSSDPTENLSKTYFPIGIRGDEGFPIFNWNINWSGFEKIFFLDKIFRTISLSHTFNGDYNASYKDGDLLTWGYSRNFSPFIGFTAKTNHKNPYTFRINYIKTLYITNSGTSTEQKHTNQLNGRIDFNRSGGFRIPIFFFRDFNIQNDINFGIDITYDNSETLMTSILISDDSDFNQQDLSKTLSIKPRITYSFTTYISGDLYFNYIYNENKTTGSTEERDLGFNVRIKIKG